MSLQSPNGKHFAPSTTPKGDIHKIHDNARQQRINTCVSAAGEQPANRARNPATARPPPSSQDGTTCTHARSYFCPLLAKDTQRHMSGACRKYTHFLYALLYETEQEYPRECQRQFSHNIIHDEETFRMIFSESSEKHLKLASVPVWRNCTQHSLYINDFRGFFSHGKANQEERKKNDRKLRLCAQALKKLNRQSVNFSASTFRKRSQIWHGHGVENLALSRSTPSRAWLSRRNAVWSSREA